jgi:dienelactone hydrolase
MTVARVGYENYEKGCAMNTIHPNLELEKPTTIDLDGTKGLGADLILPRNPKGVVLLVHGSGSSRLSPRNRFVARMLREHGLGTMLFDTESPEERERSALAGSSSISLREMANRIILATVCLQNDPHVTGLPIGFLGAGTGAAAAFLAASEMPNVVRAIVSRGGKLDSSHIWLPRITAPVLLIVGARDIPVVHHNRDALDQLGSTTKNLEIIPGARHLFEEPGTLGAVAAHAGRWLGLHIPVEPVVPVLTMVQQGL